MQICYKAFLTLLLVICSSITSGQIKNDPDSLIKQGIALHNAGKYPEAIAKYKEVLQADPANNNANYQLAFSLYVSGKGPEGIPNLESIFKTNSTLKSVAYDLLGSIYDQAHQPEKSIAAYKEGIKADPTYQRLYFNLGLAYFRNKQYADAETAAAEAIKLDPKHANSQRLYGLVAFHQNKRVNALMAFCSFLLADPQNQRAAEAYTNIQSILKGGALKAGEAIPTNDKDVIALNNDLSSIIATSKTKNLPQPQLLEYQLKSIFMMAGQFAEKKTTKTFFDKFYAGYFYKLAQSNNVPGLVKQILNKTEDVGLSDWVKRTERDF